MILRVNSIEQFLNFIEEYVGETTWVYQTNCEDGSIINLYLEEDYHYLLIEKAIHREHV